MKDNKLLNPLVSVIIPMFNCSSTIERCLVSLLNQTYFNFEAILINDGSTDNTMQKIDNLKLDSRFMIYHQSNTGVSSARNKGLEMSKGEYITFVDSDDYLDKDFIKTTVRYITQQNFDLIMCSFIEIDGKSSSTHILNIEGNNIDILTDTLMNGYINPPWGKLFRKYKIKSVFDTNLAIGEDLKFNLEYISNRTKIKVLTEPLYYYDNSSINSLSKNLDLTVKCLHNEWELVYKFCQKIGIHTSYANNLYISRTYQLVKKIFKNSNNSHEFLANWTKNKDYLLPLLKEIKEIGNTSIKYKSINQFIMYMPQWLLYAILHVIVHK